MTDGPTIHTLTTDELTARQIQQIRDLLWTAFARDEHGGFSEADWQHAVGGIHFVAELAGEIVTHASVVERTLHVAGEPIRTGYVEAVATMPALQRLGYGTAVMRAVNWHIDERYELGALGTGSQSFYERLGWHVWRGPSSVIVGDAIQPTPDEDGYIMVLRTARTPPMTTHEPISCEWRPGDVW